LEEARNKEQELNDLRLEYRTKVADLKSSQKRELDELKKAHRSTVDEMRKKHEGQLKTIRSRAENHLEIEKLRAAPLFETPLQSTVPTSELLARIDATSKAQLRRKRQEYQEELAEMMAKHTTELSAQRAHFQRQLLDIQMKYSREIEIARQSCDSQIRRLTEETEIQKQSIHKSKRIQPDRMPQSRTLVSHRILSVRPSDRTHKSFSVHRGKLRCSAAKSINIYDDTLVEFEVSEVQTIFQVRPSRRASDEFDFTFSETRKTDLPPIEPLDIESDAFSTSAVPDPHFSTTISDSRRTPKNAKKHFKKSQREVADSSVQVLSEMKVISTQLTDECRDLRNFLQNQNRVVGKAALDFQEQSMELSRAMHQSIAEVENFHRTGFRSIASPQVTYPYSIQPADMSTAHRRSSRRFRHGHD
jgi:hypothetical protein